MPSDSQCPSGGVGQLARARGAVKRRRRASRLLEWPLSREYVDVVVVAGLITLALVGMLQSLGALVEPLPIDEAWCSDQTGDDERGRTAGRGTTYPPAIVPAAPPAPPHLDPARDVVTECFTPPDNLRLLSRESRGPPPLLTHS